MVYFIYITYRSDKETRFISAFVTMCFQSMLLNLYFRENINFIIYVLYKKTTIAAYNCATFYISVESY